VGAPPRFQYAGHGLDRSNPSVTARDQTDYPQGGAAAPASWNPLTCDRFGICIQAAGGNGAPTVRYRSIRVWTW
jgi:hypothetical protein